MTSFIKLRIALNKHAGIITYLLLTQVPLCTEVNVVGIYFHNWWGRANFLKDGSPWPQSYATPH